MKKKLLNYCMNKIKKKYPNYDNDTLDIIRYGLESVYLTFTKLILILILAIYLGKLKNLLILLLFYNIIRLTAFGMHAKKSWHCLIISLTLFIGGMYLCEYIKLSLIVKSIISLICILLIYIYAPADTEKRPLINKNKRKKYKVFSLISSFIFTVLIIIFNENVISNYLLLGMIEATIMILPITYKIFNLPYDNYKNYKMGFNCN